MRRRASPLSGVMCSPPPPPMRLIRMHPACQTLCMAASMVVSCASDQGRPLHAVTRAGCSCDREECRLRGHHQQLSLSHPPQPLYSGQRHHLESHFVNLVDITALTPGTQLPSLQLPRCPRLTNVALLATLVNLAESQQRGRV
jgi:hypothetical protein